ncbi:MAG: hypothetical protein ACFCVK_11185 [Acidimicrobiales bacterium]
MLRRAALWALGRYLGGPGRGWIYASAGSAVLRRARGLSGRRPVTERLTVRTGDQIVIDALPITHKRQMKDLRKEATRTARAERRAARAEKRAAKAERKAAGEAKRAARREKRAAKAERRATRSVDRRHRRAARSERSAARVARLAAAGQRMAAQRARNAAAAERSSAARSALEPSTTRRPLRHRR